MEKGDHFAFDGVVHDSTCPLVTALSSNGEILSRMFFLVGETPSASHDSMASRMISTIFSWAASSFSLRALSRFSLFLR